MTTFISLVPVIIALVSAIVSVVGIIILLRYKTETLDRDLSREEQTTNQKIGEIKASIDNLTKDVQQALTLVKINSGEQAIINKVMTDTITGLGNRNNELEKRANEQHTRLCLIEQKVNDDD